VSAGILTHDGAPSRREQPRPQPLGGPWCAPIRADAAEPHARALTAEIHSTSTGFGGRLSTSAHGRERHARSRVRL